MKITNDDTLDKAIKERNIQGRRAIAAINGILWDQYVSKANKQRIFNTIIKSIVTYSSEIWPIREERMAGQLRATEMDYWRRAADK